MEMHLIPADFERAREIIAARAPAIGETGELAERVTFAIAQGIAEGRSQGFKEGVKQVTASNDP
jgi:flagellar biosynthesis/type III secretory pathway protein FliH